MKTMTGIFASYFIMSCIGLTAAHAEGVSVEDLYAHKIKGVTPISTLGPDLFGDQTSLSDGATSFQTIDISVVTNSGIPMNLGRKLVVDTDNTGSATGGGPGFYTTIFGGYWELNTPYMVGSYARDGWVSSANNANRCSAGYRPPNALSEGGSSSARTLFPPEDYWSGISINIPEHGEELLLPHGNTTNPEPDESFNAATRSNWQVKCTPLSNGAGEGFIVLLPNGRKYTFNWMVQRPARYIHGTLCSVNSGCWTGTLLIRKKVFIYATKVEDRFGNWVAYNYGSAPHRLLSVTSNEGATIDLTYHSDGSGRLISAVSGSNTWTYEYDSLGLKSVILPDASRGHIPMTT